MLFYITCYNQCKWGTTQFFVLVLSFTLHLSESTKPGKFGWMFFWILRMCDFAEVLEILRFYLHGKMEVRI